MSNEDRQDGTLLAAYIAGDQLAFEEIVRRHGALVLAVSRRVLGQSGEAEEVVQSVFLMLSRKAASLVSQGDLAGWLHRSAWYAATVVLRERRRRSTREKEASTVVSPKQYRASNNSLWDAIAPKLDAALSSLPEKYRVALAACYLEGRTQEEVAATMGVPRNVLAGYCRRGLEILRRKLGVRDAQLSVAALGLLLTSHALTTLPAGLAALSSAAGAGAESAKVAQLADASLKAMWWTKIKVAASIVVMACALAGAVSFGVAQAINSAGAPRLASASQSTATSRGSPASAVFTELRRKGLAISVLGTDVFPLVPVAMRFKPVNSTQLLEGIAQWNRLKIHKAPNGECVVLYPSAAENTVAQLCSDLESNDVSIRRKAAANGAEIADPRSIPYLVKAAQDGDGEVQRAARQSLRKLNWDAVVALDQRAWAILEADSEFQYFSASIGCCTGEHVLPLLEKAVRSPQAKVRCDALAALGHYGGQHARALVKEALSDSDSLVRGQAFRALADFNDERDVGVYEKILNDTRRETENERGSAVCALGYMRNNEALRVVLKSCDDSSPNVRYAAAAAVGNIGGDLAIAALERLSHSSDFRVREGVAYGLATIGGDKAVILLDGLVKDSNREVRVDAMFALGEIGNARATELLIGLAHEKDPEVRWLAIGALRKIDDAGAQKVIEDARNDSDVNVVKAATDTRLPHP